MLRGEKIVAAARGLVGAPFRLHGRDAQTGVDCIGLAMLALEGAGHGRLGTYIPDTYSIRGSSVARFAGAMAMLGLRKTRKRRAGDLMLVQAGPAQFHLMIATDEGHVHAHAGLGRVVEMPGESPWPVLGRWRWGR